MSERAKESHYILVGGLKLGEKPNGFEFNLRQELNKFYIYRKSQKPEKTAQEEAKTQASLYEYGLKSLLERANQFFFFKNREEQRLHRLYTREGQLIESLLEIPHSEQYLVACYDQFEPINLDRAVTAHLRPLQVQKATTQRFEQSLYKDTQTSLKGLKNYFKPTKEPKLVPKVKNRLTEQ